MSTLQESVTPTAETLTGRVKWFNNKSGFGFVTVTDGSKSGTDFFVHHSVINVASQQYRYLVQGEYVEFSVLPSLTGAHEFQVSTISGIKGGKLMCETRNELKLSRTTYQTTENTKPVKKSPPQQKVSSTQTNDKKDWTLIKKNSDTQSQTTTKPTKPTKPRKPRQPTK